MSVKESSLLQQAEAAYDRTHSAPHGIGLTGRSDFTHGYMARAIETIEKELAALRSGTPSALREAASVPALAHTCADRHWCQACSAIFRRWQERRSS